MNSNATSQVARTVRGCGVIPLGTLDQTTQEAYGWLVFITVTTIITCPISTGLNTLIMIVVKTEHRVKTKSNIELACLSSTDAVMGVRGQPLFISWLIAELQGNTFSTYCVRIHAISENGLKSVRCGITVSPGYGERRTLHCHQTFFEVWNLSHWNSLDCGS